MSNLSHVSASSITLFSECQRKWYYRYLQGHKGETSDAMRRGTQVHEHLEHFLTHGEMQETTSLSAQIASAGLEHLPENVLQVEASLEDFPLSQHLGVDFKGFIDVLAEDSPTQVHILDHKTTSNLKYAKTELELASNIQLVIYAKHVLDNRPQYSSARLTHVYYTTRRPFESKMVSVVLSRAEIDLAFVAVAAQVAEMLAAAERGIDDTTKNPSYCRAYNKVCDHYQQCFVSLERKMSEPMSEKKINLMAFLRGETDEIAGVKMSSSIENLESAVVDSTTGAVVDSTPAPAAPAPAAPAAATDAANQVRLFVGVHQLSVKVEPLSVALEPLMKEVCEMGNVKHISLIPYANGWNLLAGLIQERGLPPGNWYVEPTSRYYVSLSEDLHRAATHVFIRG